MPARESATGFKDHFSAVAAGYARHRPTYPADLFSWLSEQCERRLQAWDCATGSGQAAIALAAHFESVAATDASAEQVRAAARHPAVHYSVAPAEATPFDAGAFDLITVGQALHWFDVERFYAEAGRVAAPGGVLAAWSYGRCSVTHDVDACVEFLYSDLTGPFWPPERALIERGYRDFDLPGPEIEAPAFAMQLEWRSDDMLGYLRTWSACHRYVAVHGTDPVDRIEATLKEAWGDAARTVRWPLALRVCRLPD